MITDAACDPADKDNVKAAAVLKLESLVFIHWELTKEKEEEEARGVDGESEAARRGGLRGSTTVRGGWRAFGQVTTA